MEVFIMATSNLYQLSFPRNGKFVEFYTKATSAKKAESKFRDELAERCFTEYKICKVPLDCKRITVQNFIY